MSPPGEGIWYATEQEKRNTNNLRKNEAVGPKQKWHTVVDVSGDESKILQRTALHRNMEC